MSRREAILLALGLFVFAPAHSAVADEYQFLPVVAFPGFATPECYLRGINNAGMAVGWATIVETDPQGNLHQVYTGITWTRAAGKTALHDPTLYLTGVSETGWASGLGKVRYLPTGQTYVPPTLPGTAGLAKLWKVNDAGIAVGSIQTCICSNSAGIQQVAYIWDAVGGARTINVAGAKELISINNSNVAVGNIRSDAFAGVGDAFVCDLGSGQTTILSEVLPQPPAGVVYKIVASDINDVGQVTGYIRENTTARNIGFVWSAQAGAVLMSPPVGAVYRQDVRPAAININGVVVGTLGDNAGGNRPFVYDAAHGVRDLATLTTVAPTTFNFWFGSSINDHGWITAYGYAGSGGSASAVFVPVQTCLADFNGSGTVTVQDIFDYLAAWFAGDASADFNGGGLSVQDIFDFLGAWFGGC